jgi:hypothetical protein
MNMTVWVKVKTLPVLVSKVLVSECPRALVVLTGNLPSVEYSTDVLLLTKNTYSNDITNWHLGRLSSAKVTHNAANTFSASKFIRLKVFFLNPTKASIASAFDIAENTYSNDITNWHLGRLSNAKVTHNAANTPSIPWLVCRVHHTPKW